MCFPYRIHMGSEGYIFYLHEFHPINPSTIRMFRLHHLTMVTHRFGSTQVVGQWYGDLLGMEFSYPVILWGEFFRFTIFINISKKKTYGKTTRIQGKVERGCFFCFVSLRSFGESINQSINQSKGHIFEEVRCMVIGNVRPFSPCLYCLSSINWGKLGESIIRPYEGKPPVNKPLTFKAGHFWGGGIISQNCFKKPSRNITLDLLEIKKSYHKIFIKIFHPRWFNVTFSSPSWRSLNHPKKVTKNHLVFFFKILEHLNSTNVPCGNRSLSIQIPIKPWGSKPGRIGGLGPGDFRFFKGNPYRIPILFIFRGSYTNPTQTTTGPKTTGPE